MLPANPTTRRLSLAELSEFYDSPLLPILDNSFDGIGLVDPQTGAITYANPTLREWLNIPFPAELPSNVNDFLITDGSAPLLDQIKEAWRRDQPDIALHFQLLSAAAERKRVKLRVCRLSLAHESLIGIIINDGNREPANLEPTPQHRDPLTGLPDRAFLLSQLSALMDARFSRDRQFAVLFIDLDNFKQVNDTHGHLVGDRVLSIAARRLSDSVRDGDHVVRFGGDEFVVLIEGVAARSDIEPLVSRIHSVLAEAISLPEGDFTLTVSIGAALASPEHQTPEALLAMADRAMYAAKRANT